MNNKTTAGIVVIAVVLLGLPMALKLKRDHDRAAATYHLVSVDGHELPYAPKRQRQRRQVPEIRSGTLSLYNDGTFHATMGYASPSGETVKSEFKGTYAGNGSDYSLLWEGTGETRVTMEENKLTMDNEGSLFIYER